MDRREQMRCWLARREREGLTFRELSETTGVPVGTLASWAFKLRREALRGKERRSSVGFVELVPTTKPGTGRIEILLARDRRILIEAEFDEDQLVRVVRALERC